MIVGELRFLEIIGRKWFFQFAVKICLRKSELTDALFLGNIRLYSCCQNTHHIWKVKVQHMILNNLKFQDNLIPIGGIFIVLMMVAHREISEKETAAKA